MIITSYSPIIFYLLSDTDDPLWGISAREGPFSQEPLPENSCCGAETLPLEMCLFGPVMILYQSESFGRDETFSFIR